MPKKLSTTEKKLELLNELENNPDKKHVISELRKIISAKNNILVAKAAKICRSLYINELIPNLISAFDRFIKDPIKLDKGCIAMPAIIKALDIMEYDKKDIFLKGVKHTQFEPGYPKSVDAAAPLRAKSVFALARLGYDDIFFILSDLLMDPEPQARSAAVEVLSQLFCNESELLLRMKIKTGDTEDQIISECLSALMRLNQDRSINFVEKYLNSNDPIISESAAFAISESRNEKGLNILIKFRENNFNPNIRDMVLLPIALTKLDKAFDYLIEIIKEDHKDSAILALKALKIFKHNENYVKKIKQAVDKRNEDDVSRSFLDEFDDM